MIARNKERLTFTQDLDRTLTGAEIAHVCVDTPPSASGDADLTRVWAVIRSLATAHDLRAVAMKSTVPVGTGARARVLLDEIGLSRVGYVSNPEFTAEGRAVTDFLAPDRIVIGRDDDTADALVAALHSGIDAPVATMDGKSAEMVKLASNALLAGRHVALLGMASKPGADDMREAPSTVLAGRLLAEGAHVRAWDPLARPAAGEPWDSVTRFPTPRQALAGADAAVIVTEWPELAEIDWAEAWGGMRTPILFDGRNLLDPTRLRRIGFRSTSVGRP